MAVYLRYQIAAMAGVTIDTLRYYEEKGLLSPNRAPNGYRVYSEETIERLIFIKRAKEAGFSLEEIRKTLLLFEYDFNVEELSTVMLEGVAAKITEIDGKIERLMEVREVLMEIYSGLRDKHTCQTMEPFLKKNK